VNSVGLYIHFQLGVKSVVPLKHGWCIKGNVNTIHRIVYSSQYCTGGTNVRKSTRWNIKDEKYGKFKDKVTNTYLTH
jgi:hypothetical protein